MRFLEYNVVPMAKTVLTYGTFDLFHIGHLRLIERARALGDRLVVAISTDEFNAGKGKRSIVPFEQRRQIVEAIRHVDLVIPEETWDQKIADVKQYDVNVFVIGEDWAGKFDFLTVHCDVVYLPRTQNISTTEISAELDDATKEALRVINQQFQ